MKDPRHHNRLHKILDIIVIAIYAVVSGADTYAQIENFGGAVRSHWGIENPVHWVLDIAFREDESRIRKGHSPENSAVLRHIALNLLNKDSTFKGSVKTKRLDAAMDVQYLQRVMFS